MNRIILFLMVTFISIQCMSGTIDPKVPDKKYIEYGIEFPYVLQLTDNNEKNFTVLGSCVIIDKNWIVTAAHVAKEMKSCYVTHENKKINIDRMIIHKDFADNKFGLADIAVAHLEKDIFFNFYPSLYSEDAEIDSQCSISGFGFGGTFETGSKFIDGKKRAGLNIIDRIDDDLLICSPSINTKKTSLEFLITHGDSGGGLFINNQLAGINSCVMTTDKKPNSSYGDESGHTRISKYKPWILKNINEYKK